MEFLRDSNFDFMKYRRLWVAVSVVLVVVSVLAVFVHGKLNIGVDFAGGTQLTLQFQEEPVVDEIRGILAGAGLDDAQIQRFGESGSNEVLIKAPVAEEGAQENQERILAALDQRYNADARGLDLNRAGADAVAGVLAQLDPEGVMEAGGDTAQSYYEGIAESILEVRKDVGIFASWEQVASAEGVSPETQEALRENASLGAIALLGAENVGPQIGRELRTKGVLAVVLSLVGMLVYIWVRFELRFGIGAVIASFHDVIVVLGLYALLDFEFNLTTVAAFLTLIGYSVNDTVVIFDRVRETLRKYKKMAMTALLNKAINATLARTLLTSVTTLLALIALFLFGGEVIRGFVMGLIWGVVIGTYSSIAIAVPLLLQVNLRGTVIDTPAGEGEARARGA